MKVNKAPFKRMERLFTHRYEGFWQLSQTVSVYITAPSNHWNDHLYPSRHEIQRVEMQASQGTRVCWLWFGGYQKKYAYIHKQCMI